jgi:PAS domain S-box-containing protein
MTMATILVVDDEPTNCEFLVTLLGYRGHRLLEAADGLEALALAQRERPDLVIADILMPTMDGYELVHQLRADPTIAQIPVIFYTAYYHEQEAQALAQACGVTHILTKPSEPGVVLRTVDVALGLAAPPPPPLQNEFDREHLRLLTDKLSQQATELQKANLQLSALIEISLQLASERDLRRLLEHFCYTARDLIGAKHAAVGVLDDDRQSLQHFFISGMDAERAVGIGAPMPGQGILGKLLAERQPSRLQNPGGDPGAVGFPPGYPPIYSLLAAPIVSLAQVYGWICLIDKIGAAEFSDADERLIAILAAQVGRIYENGSFYQEAQRYAAELEQQVAERARVETALRATEERFRALIENSPDAIALFSQDGVILYGSPATARILGYSLDEFVGRNAFELIHPDDHTIVTRQLAEAIQEPATSIPVHARVRHKDGSWRFLEGVFTNLIGNPSVDAIVCNYRDITERRQAEEHLAHNYNLLHAVIEGTPDAVYVKDLEGRYLMVNAAGASLFGLAPEEIIDKDDTTLFGADIARPLRADDRRIMGRGETETYEETATANGVTYTYLSTKGPYRDQHGNIIGVIGISRDITERKRLEEQFRQAQKMESIGQLAGGIAHDFNNMLSAVIGFLGSAQEQLSPDAPAQHDLAAAEDAAWRAARLTRQLLAFARKQIVELQVVNLNTVILDLDKMLRRLIGADIELLTLPAPDLGQVKVDPGHIEQVILNLAVNARDAMPQGGKLTIEMANIVLDADYAQQHVGVTPGRYIMLAISDTGIGMDAEVQQHVFEPFFTTKEIGKGTGLGLATCYGIIKQHGGHIWVYSEVGHGTTFKIYLPQVEESPDALLRRDEAKAMPQGSETVLLVEDELLVRELASAILRQQGYTVLEAANGEEALHILQQYDEATIDLLITDVVMPQMGGKALAEHANIVYPDLKVLFISGYATDAIAQHGQLDPGRHFLSKPFTRTAFARKVREVLDS